jgi:hypothetical protein
MTSNSRLGPDWPCNFHPARFQGQCVFVLPSTLVLDPASPNATYCNNLTAPDYAEVAAALASPLFCESDANAHARPSLFFMAAFTMALLSSLVALFR